MEVRGLGQLLAALAAAFFVRAIAGPGPALLPPAEDTDDDEAGEGGGGGGVPPVTIRWARITCALMNKRGEVVSRCTAATAPPLPHLAAAARTKTLAIAHLPICPSVVLSFRLPRVLVCVDSLNPVLCILQQVA